MPKSKLFDGLPAEKKAKIVKMAELQFKETINQLLADYETQGLGPDNDRVRNEVLYANKVTVFYSKEYPGGIKAELEVDRRDPGFASAMDRPEEDFTLEGTHPAYLTGNNTKTKMETAFRKRVEELQTGFDSACKKIHHEFRLDNQVLRADERLRFFEEKVSEDGHGPVLLLVKYRVEIMDKEFAQTKEFENLSET